MSALEQPPGPERRAPPAIGIFAFMRERDRLAEEARLADDAP